MTKINFGRVILGGLVAGLILVLGDFLMHAVALGEQWQAAMAAQGVAEPGTGSIVFFCILDLIFGIAMVWLYAAIRPRFGAGARTAIVTGILVWFFGWFWHMSGLLAMGMYPKNLILMTLLWGFVQMPLAAFLGAWLYKEA
jgi:hypothetical protein